MSTLCVNKKVSSSRELAIFYHRRSPRLSVSLGVIPGSQHREWENPSLSHTEKQRPPARGAEKKLLRRRRNGS